MIAADEVKAQDSWGYQVFEPSRVRRRRLGDMDNPDALRNQNQANHPLVQGSISGVYTLTKRF